MSIIVPRIRKVNADRCPGVLRPYVTTDGAMIRFRLPGGYVSTEALAQVSAIGERYGNREIALTSRNNLQLRALPECLPEELTDAAFATGLMPKPSHERIRTVIASPLSSTRPHHVNLEPIVANLDAAMCADDRLAELPGRFLIVLDDGRGDVFAGAFDIGFMATSPTAGVLMVGGSRDAIKVDVAGLVPAVLRVAHAFLDFNEGREKPAWHTREMPQPGDLLVGDRVPFNRPEAQVATPLGVHGDHAVVGVPLGLLTPEQVAALAAVADQVVVTPWRSIVVPGGAAHLEHLVEAGLAASDSPWRFVTACYGKPCSNAQIETRPLAEALVAAWPSGEERLVHISGCERRCGEPGGVHLDMVSPASLDEILQALAAS